MRIPADVPAGDHSYAWTWTWTSQESGTQGYCMNCAPLTVKSSSSSSSSGKRRASTLARRDSVMGGYPPLAVYDMAGLNGCRSELSSSPVYPYPRGGRRAVEHLAAGSPAYANITCSGCFAEGVSWSGPSSSSGSGGSGSSGGGGGSSTTGDGLTAGGKGIDSTATSAVAVGTT